MEACAALNYTQAMTAGQDCEDFFLFPRASHAEEVMQSIRRLEKLLPVLSPEQQKALKDLINTASELSPHAFRVQHLNGFEFFLLTTLVDLDMRLQALEMRTWVHPPFP
jgi:hypothetical protein